ncbi:hypothetical protein PROFUN_11060 [Planoprotostelium fungivorum]|uniref:CCAAT-binding factor domain-containing protein n=1 Tax=Planoprotostelium fungivorum TaxID=1890364 RepID=A0A2P6NBR0_9EUKA|nr:hypothetical protein PROFUN_11060 [Planoprotostelium fungivorum]
MAVKKATGKRKKPEQTIVQVTLAETAGPEEVSSVNNQLQVSLKGQNAESIEHTAHVLHKFFGQYRPHFYGQTVKPTQTWIQKEFQTFKQTILNFIDIPILTVQLCGVDMVMDISISESCLEATTKDSLALSSPLFEKMIQRVLSSTSSNIEQLRESIGEKYIAQYDDIRFTVFKVLRKSSKEAKEGDREVQHDKARRIYPFLESMELPSELTELFVGTVQRTEGDNLDDVEDHEIRLHGVEHFKAKAKLEKTESSNYENLLQMKDRLFLPDQPKKHKKKKGELVLPELRRDIKPMKEKPKKNLRRQMINLESHRKMAEQCWLEFLRLEMPAEIFKKVLTTIETDILPLMEQPSYLLDYIVRSYDQGGVISLMALNGLFTLITRYNTDYPDYYKKLYQLLSTNIFLTKYRVKFFKLLDDSLSSKLVPVYILASFAKKLARLTLTVPPHGITVCLILIYNIIRRNPTLKVLIHREPKVEMKKILLIGLSEERESPDKPLAECNGYDPYDEKQSDMTKTRALDSSLWELQTLKQHYCPQIVRMTKIFETEPNTIYEVEKFIAESPDTIFEQNTKKTPTQPPPFSIEKAKEVFDSKDDYSIWIV